MPRYRFELKVRAAYQVQAAAEEELPGTAAAMAHAARVANELSRGINEEPPSVLSVVDERGNELARIPILADQLSG